MNDLCVVIPVYKLKLKKTEEMSIERTCDILSNRDIIFVAPIGLQTVNYKQFLNKENVSIQYFDPKYFSGISGYNRLMLAKRFYQTFLTYEYMLIAQPDAFILSNSDKMDEFMKKGYQYWGAPWKPYLKIYRLDVKGARHFERILKPVTCKSGNGGFSLRHIKATIELLERRRITARLWCNNYNEDGFYAYFGHSKEFDWFNCPSEEEASDFALEADMKSMLSSGHKVFAVHAWEKLLGGLEELKKYVEPYDRK